MFSWLHVQGAPVRVREQPVLVSDQDLMPPSLASAALSTWRRCEDGSKFVGGENRNTNLSRTSCVKTNIILN